MKIRVKLPKFRQNLRKQGIIFLLILFLFSIAVPFILPPVSASPPPEKNSLHLLEKARNHYQNRQFEQSINTWQQLAEIFALQGDPLNQAMALSNLSLTYQQLGQWPEAKQAIAQSLSLLKSLQPTTIRQRILAESLEIKGNLEFSLVKFVNALETWQRATNLYQSLGDQQGFKQSQINQAQAMQSLGFYPRACRTLLEVFNINKQECQVSDEELQNLPENLPISLQILGLRSLGNVLRETGQLQASHQVLLKSWQLAQSNNYEENLPEISLILGKTLRALGNQSDYQELTKIDLNPSVSCFASDKEQNSPPFYQQAIACYRQAQFSDDSLTRVKAKLNLLSLFIQIRQWQELPYLIAQIEQELTHLPPSKPTITAQLKLTQNLMCLRSLKEDNEKQSITPILQSCPPNIAVTELNIHQIPTWEEIYQRIAIALQQAQTIGDQLSQTNALGYLGATEAAMGQPLRAQQTTQLALQQISAFKHPELAYFWQWQLGRLYRLQGKTEEAIATYTLAIESLESLRGDLVTSHADIQFNFRDQVEPVYRELVDQLLQEPYQQTEEIRQIRLAKARDTIELLQLAELNNFFQEACLEVEFREIDEIDPQAAVIYPIILPQRLAIILSLPNQSLSYYETPFNSSSGDLASVEIERVFDELFANLNPYISSPDPLKPHQQFYNWLIRPLEAKLEQNEIKTLVFVLDGILQSVPMAALHDGQQYLIEKYKIALTPGLHLLSPQSLSTKNLKTLAGGLAESRQGFSALPGVEREFEQIRQIIPAEVLLNQSFTRKQLQRQIEESEFPIVHLATHGQFSSQVEETFLLTWDERINVKDLDQLLQKRAEQSTNPLELLILSACQTATGDRRAVLGLAGVAVRSGAQSTLATLWSVQDQSTADLIGQFYQNLNQSKTNKADALRQAQLSLLRSGNYQHPFYWSPFVLIGNWL